MDSVLFTSSVEDDRSILIMAIYQNRSGRTETMILPDRTEVPFAEGDTIRLNITRKYLRPTLAAIVQQAGLTVESEAYYAFSSRRNAHRFGLSLTLLSRGEADSKPVTAAREVFRQRRS
jgi:hypothetical protein